MSRPTASWQTLGEQAFARCDRVSAELLALTYGSFVRQLLADYEDVGEVNRQLDASGYSIGGRLADDFVAKARIQHCATFGDTADVVAKVAFRMFLGIGASAGSWSADKRTFALTFEENPLAEFAELPDAYAALWYSNILCGVLRGALEMVNMKVDATFVRCRLRGDDVNEIRVSLREMLAEKPPVNDD